MAIATKKTGSKKLEIALGIIVALPVLLFAFIFLWQKYELWKFNHDLAALQAEEDRPYLEDTYGGKTPKETLELFIAAVEKGDYDLASKYFILTKQEEWRKTLKEGVEQNKLSELVRVVKDGAKELEKAEPLWLEMKKYTYTTKPGNVLFDFAKYPNDNWKIVEI